MASSSLRAGRFRGQPETGEGRTQCTDPATDDPRVAEVGVHDIDDINADVHANDVQAPEGDTILLLKV